jgi:hypothetical protein
MTAPEIIWPTKPEQLAEVPWLPIPETRTLAEQHDKAADSVYEKPVPADNTPAAPETQPAPAPQQPTEPTHEEKVEQRRKESAARAAKQFRKEADRLTRISRWAMAAVILISAIITTFGAGNAAELFSRHHTGNPWSWLPYPALEAGLIVEIQIGGFLGEHKRSVVFWGAALRFVTALAAITLCFYGPAEQADWAGAAIHAIGPFVQFFLAEYLAHARKEFRVAIDALHALAEGRQQAATVDLSPRTAGDVAHSKERTKKRAERRPSVGKSRPSASSVPDGRASHASSAAPAARPTASGPSVDEDLLVRAREAADRLAAKDEKLNRDNLVREIRAGGKACPNAVGSTVLAIVRAERGAPDLRPITQQGA